MRIRRVGPDYLFSRGEPGDRARIYALAARLEVEYLARFLSERGVTHVVDVGANDGTFCLELRAVGYEGALLSFEPAPEPYSRLRRHAGRDPGWTVRPVALGDRREDLPFNVTRASGFGSLLTPNALARRVFPGGTDIVERITVRCRRLDEVAPEIAQDPSSRRVFLKIDTQGYDLKVLDGAAGVLDAVIGIQVELSDTPLYENAPPGDALTGRLERVGFEMVAAFPVTWDPQAARVLEYDAVFARSP